MSRRFLSSAVSCAAFFSASFFFVSPASATTCVTDATRAAATILNADTDNWEMKRVCLVSARSGCLTSSGTDEAVLCCPASVPGIGESESCPGETSSATTPSITAPTSTLRSTWIPPDVQRCMRSGNCTIDHIVRIGAAFANFLFGISGAIFLLIFVYGGFLYLTAGGSGDNVKKAQKMLVDAAIGMVLIFGAGTLIRFIHSTIVPPSRCETEEETRGYTCMYVVGDTQQQRLRNGVGCLVGRCDQVGQNQNVMCCPVTSPTRATAPTPPTPPAAPTNPVP